MISLLNEEPNIIYLTEHHIVDYEMDALCIPKYRLGAGYGRKKFKNGDICILIREDLNFTNINLQKHCKERDIEIVAIQLKLNEKKVIILSIYRAPVGDYDYFLNKLDYILNVLHRKDTEFILCGYININYLESNNRKANLVEILSTYNLRDTVYFPTRTTNNSTTLIDNIFIDKRRSYNVKPCINRLPDHDAQLITLKNIKILYNIVESVPITNINKNNIDEFQMLLSGELWDNIFGDNNVNNMYNNFHNTFLRYFNACFPKKELKNSNNNNMRITKGIRTSCIRKR
jgi:hypothetical protein